MRKRIWFWVIASVLMLAILFVPVPAGVLKDGGTREYSALTYKIVDWNRLTEDGMYQKTRVYFFPECLKSLDELWEYEKDQVRYSFLGTILEMNEKSVVAEPIPGENERLSADNISFSRSGLADIGAEEGSIVKVTYTGGIRKSYPASVDAVAWEIATDLRHMEYQGVWLDKQTAEKYESEILFSHIRITAIYSDCFFARPIFLSPMEIKLNGSLSEEWCVGDQVLTTHENVYYDRENNRVEADLLTLEISNFQPDPGMAYKPVLYLYPQEETEVSVRVELNGKLTCTYPDYDNGWSVTASPDGILTDAKGQQYNYLYWEGETLAAYDLSRGFCVKGRDTAAFLEEALAKLGLTRREANEFIVYWLPLMQENPYNMISFQTDIYTEAAKLEISPAPDTLIRVFMAWQGTDSYVELPPQQLTAPERTGFTVVEWGGTELKP